MMLGRVMAQGYPLRRVRSSPVGWVRLTERSTMRIGQMRSGFWVVAAALLLVLGGRANATEREYERYSVVLINDQRVGFSRESGTIVAATLVTSTEMILRIARFDDELRVSVVTELVETLDGEP